MASLDKLSIMGVRSFDNRQMEIIEFFTPLTLIVGYNGAGKTTIIECLKYAATGELPPNSKGGAFIHDPKLCGEREVLAQVMLRFKLANGSTMTASRRLQLTVKKTARQQKTLEANLVMRRSAERQSISTRALELDQMVPQYLGASRAILDNVIFCHQDESLWPMSEPSVLKKKFDEIFEAMKYTKAVDNIKILRKKQNEELAKLKIHEEHAKTDKDRAQKVEKQSKTLSAEVEELREKTKTLNARIKDAVGEFEEASNRSAQYNTMVSQLEGRRIEAKAKDESLQRTKERMKAMDDSDEDLKTMLSTYEERVQLFQQDLESYTRHWHDLDSKKKQARNDLSSKQGERGRLQAEQAQHERQLSQREQIVKEAARRHAIRGFDEELDEEKVQAFVDRVSKMAKEQHAALEKASHEFREEARGIQTDLSAMNERKNSMNQSKGLVKTQTTANEQKLTGYRRELNSIDVDEGRQAVLESTLKDFEDKLRQAKEKVADNPWQSALADATAKLRSLDDEVNKMQAEMVQATKRASETAQIDLLNTQLKDAQKSLDTMHAAHYDRIAKLLGSAWTNENLEELFQRAVEAKQKNVDSLNQQAEGARRELDNLEFRFKSAGNDLKTKQQNLKAEEERVRESLNEDDATDRYPAILEKVESDLEVLKSDINAAAGFENYYEKGIKHAEQHNVCRLCERTLASSTEKSRFLTRLRSLIQQVKDKVANEELAACEEDLKALKSVASNYERWSRLKDAEVPDLQKEVDRLQPKVHELRQSVERYEANIGEARGSLDELQSLSKTVQTLVKHFNDIARLKSEEQRLATRNADQGPSRNVEIIQEELARINEQQRNMRSTEARLTSERDSAKEATNQLELQIRDTRSELVRVTGQLKAKGDIEAQIEEIRRDIDEKRKQAQQLDDDLDRLLPQIASEQEKLDNVYQRQRQKEERLQQEETHMTNTVHQVELAGQEIRAYQSRNGSAQLSQCENELSAIEREIGAQESEQREVTGTINKLNEQGRNHEETKRHIEDNLQYRADARSLRECKDEITRLEALDAEADQAHWTREAQKWQMQRNKLAAEQAGVVGELKSKDSQLERLLTEWNTEYKDAGQKYKEAHIKVEATKAAVEDLGRYGGALDKAIMKYHSLKMEEINRTIEDLWRRTYQGSDVDTVMIRSDNDNVKGNKSYNYRVVMVKQDAEMDMRGRCSAGQKVLASIIIRLALAESFGSKCGIIALDEPTTNLDRENIRALAESLAVLIKARQHQANFQLIVITHDEDFLRHMHCNDFTDSYYRVFRNNVEKTEIEKNSIAQVL